jgi:HAD superfamily hydrolase (TIGR01484 family)
MFQPIEDLREHLINIQQVSSGTSTSLYHNCLIATDMDGTLTKDGKFTSTLLKNLEQLAIAKIPVLIITGRSAGWVSAISSLMPIIGAIAENGGLFYPSGSSESVILTPITDVHEHRQNLSIAFNKLQSYFPQIRESADNQFRVTDWTFDVASLTTDELKTLADLCQQMGWGFTYSNVQCHIKPESQDKATGLLKVLYQYFPTYSPQQVITVGDSPNDESLFNSDYFPLSVGVANVRKYANDLNYKPSYITNNLEVDGFVELYSLLMGN